MWQFEATFCSLFCSDWFRRRHQLWCYSCGSDRNAACLFIYLKDRRQRQERHLKASLYLFLPTFFRAAWKEPKCLILEWMSWRNPLTSVLLYRFCCRGGFGRAGLTSSSSRSHWRGSFALLLLRFDVKLPQVFWREDAFVGRPGPVCYSVTMEEKILLWSRFYIHCDVTWCAAPEGAGKWSVYNGSFVFCLISSSH